MKEPHGGRKCGAQKPNRTPGETCQNPAGYGTDHPGFGRCKRHFGATPGPARGAFREMAAAMGDPIHTDPAEAVMAEIARSAGHVKWLADKVAAFSFPQTGVVIDQDGVTPSDVDPEGAMSPNQKSWYLIYREERRHLIEVSAVAIKAGFKDREIKIAERQGEMLANAVDAILGQLGLTPAQLDRVPDVVPAVLRQIATQPRAIEE